MKRLCAAGFVSDLGDWLLRIALPLYVLAQTGSALGTSAVFLAELLPAVVAGAFAGVLVDRWPPRATLVGVSAVQAAGLLPLLFVDHRRLFPVYLTAGLEAVFAAVFDPAKQAAVPALAAPGELGRANAAVGLSENLARLVGSPLGGLALTGVGLRGVVLADAATYLGGGAILATLHPSRPAAQPSSFAGDWAEGLRVIRTTRPLPAALLVTLIGQVAQGMFVVLYVLFVTRTLAGSDAEVGLYRGVQAVGGVLGGLLVARYAGRLGNRVLVAGGYLSFGLITLLTWNSANVTTNSVWYSVLFALAGIPGVATLTGTLTAVQTATPPAVLGRVLGAAGLTSSLAQAVGILVAGLAAGSDVVGLLDLQGCLYLACGALALVGFANCENSLVPKRIRCRTVGSTTSY